MGFVEPAAFERCGSPNPMEQPMFAQHHNARSAAARAVADLRRHSATLFLGYRAEVEERLALAHHDDDPAAASRAIDDLQARIDAQADRIAAEDAAFARAPLVRRRIEAGHRFLLVTRAGEQRFVPLLELTDAELGLASTFEAA